MIDGRGQLGPLVGNCFGEFVSVFRQGAGQFYGGNMGRFGFGQIMRVIG